MRDDVKVGIVFGLLFVVLTSVGFWATCFKINTQRSLFNQKFSTNYSFKEWYWGSDMIVDYLNKGEQKTINLDLSN